MDRLLTISEAAKLINVHPETLRRWDNDKILVALRVNDRGDRRYREKDILEFMKTNKSTILHSQSLEYASYKIRWWNEDGFHTLPARFDLMAKIYATKGNEFIGFIFYVTLLNKIKSGLSEDDMDKLAISKVKEYFDAKKAFDGDRFTFELEGSIFYEIQNPEWWEEKYGKSLLAGLRVLAHATHHVTAEQKAWRVILRFNTKQGDYWVPNTFGKNNQFHEYFVWIDSKELEKLNLPNTPKGAEILAIDFGVKRFEETKDEDGNHNLSKIDENNSAFYNGECMRGSGLPDEIYERK